jgi:ankyrin repeat protein
MLAANFLLASQRLANGESPLMAALYRGHHEIVDAVIDAGAEIDIFAAAATGRLADLQRCVSDATVNSFAYDGWTPLHLAAFFGHLEAARLLLDAGAGAHAVSDNGLTNTPLHAATAGKHSGVALLLIERGGNAHAVDSGGYTPLHIATQNGLADVVAAMGAGG